MSKPTKQQKKAMDKLGISLTDASGKVKSGKVLFDELREKFSGLTEAQKTQYAATIFGKEAMSGMLAIINASDKDYNKLYKNLSNCNGEAEKMADTMQDNLKGAITNLKSAFEEMQIAVAKAVVPILTKVVKVVTKVVNVFNALPQPIKSAIGRVIGAIALLSPTFLILGKMVKTVSTVIGAFKKLKIAAMIFKTLPALITPHTLIIVGALAAIIAITIAVIKNWDKCKAAAKKFGKAISKIFQNLLKVIKKIIEGWIQQFKNLVKIFEWVGKMLKLSVKFWLKVLSGVIKVLKKIVGGWINLFKNLGKKFFGLGKNIVQGLINGIKSMFGKVSKVIKSLGDKVKNGFKKALKIHSPSRVFASYGGYIGEGLIEGIDGQEGAIDTKFKGLANKIKSLGNVRSNLNFGGLNNLALSGATGNSSGFNNISNSNKSMGITQDVKMYITIPNASEEGAKKVATEFKNMTKSTLKDEMTELFMNDVLRD